MWQAIGKTYQDAWRFVAALPYLVGVVVFLQGVQHLAEWTVGMFDSRQAYGALAHHPARMITGALKLFALVVTHYWVDRFLLGCGSRQRATTVEPVALRLFAAVALFSMAIWAVTLLLTAWLPGLGMEKAVSSTVVFAWFAASIILQLALTLWMVGAALGDRKATPDFALKHARGHILWGLGLTILANALPVVLHSALNLAAIGRAPATAAILLTIDAVCVGFLAVVLASTRVQIAKRMLRQSNLHFSPPLTAEERRAALSGHAASA